MRLLVVLATLAPYPYENKTFSASSSFSTNEKGTENNFVSMEKKSFFIFKNLINKFNQERCQRKIQIVCFACNQDLVFFITSNHFTALCTYSAGD